MGVFDWSSLLPAITLIGVVLTVFVGILGLRQGHYSKGKITRRGRRAVAGMVALGVATVVSAFAAQQVSDAKEREEAVTRARQFASQMTSLQSMQLTLADSIRRQQTQTENLRSVQTTLDASLVRQERLSIAAAENLRQGRLLQDLQSRNTARVIRSISNETNRLSVRDLGAQIYMPCYYVASADFLSMTMRHIILHVVRPGVRAQLVSITPDRDPNSLDQLSRFFINFSGDLGRFETFSPWTGASMSVELRATESDQPESTSREELFFRRRNLAGLTRQAVANGARHCPIQIQIKARGWTLGDFRAELVELDPGSFYAVAEDAILNPTTPGQRPH